MPNLKLYWAYKHSLSRAKISNYYNVMVLFCIIKYINYVSLLYCKWIWVKTNLCWYWSFIIVFHKLIISYIYIYIEVVKTKNVFLFFSGLDISDEDISILKPIYEEISKKDQPVKTNLCWYWHSVSFIIIFHNPIISYTYYTEVVKIKNVFLFFPGPDISDENISILKPIYEEKNKKDQPIKLYGFQL